MKHWRFFLLLGASAVAVCAQNTVFTYQGRVQVSGTDFSGAGQFKFALVTSSNANHQATAAANLSGQFVTSYTVTFGGNGYVTPPAVTVFGGGGSGATAHATISGGVVTSVIPDNAGSGYSSAPTVQIAPPPPNISFTTFWSNDGTSVAGSEPSAAVSVPVSNGLFTVAIGDTTLANMASLDASIFLQPKLQLRIWFSDGVNPFAALNPPQDLTPTPYAAYAANAANAVTASNLTGTISSNNIGAGSITGVMLATGAVGSNQLATGAVTTSALGDSAVTVAKIAVATNRFMLALINPTPAANDSFGSSLAALGNDRVVIAAPYDETGAQSRGAAYLFGINGALLTTFTHPTPEFSDPFGNAVAAVGNDRVLIGAKEDRTGAFGAGAAYLFSTNGTLLNTITNPTPAVWDNFGYSLVAVGTDRVLIGANADETGATDAGAAYLFRTNGTLLTTFPNPAPSIGSRFGSSLAAVGTDRVLISAPADDTGATNAGAAYLFSTNGTLLTTFTNPSPALEAAFGFSMAAVGTDRVLVSAPFDGTGAAFAGAAHLFSVNGALLTTFTNPTPADFDLFGYSVSAVASDRLLISAPLDDTGATNAGAAYLFSTNGTLLETFTNPAPAIDDVFGSAVAAAGNRLLIGASGDDTGATDSGVAYLFGTEIFAPGLVAEGVRAGSITAVSLADETITTVKLANGAVTTPKLADGAVTTLKLADGAVTTPKLADGGVTAAKLDSAIGVWTRSGNNVVSSAGNVGIGTTNPQAPLHIAVPGPVLYLQDPCGFACQAGYISYRDAGSVETAFVGFGTAGNPTFSVVNRRTSGNIELLPISGRVGVKRTPTANAFEVEGNASKTASGSWLANSDARIKTGVRTVTGALDKLSQVRLVEFHYTDEYRAQHPSIEDRTYLNVLAQEFQKVFPDAVKRSGDKLPNGDEILQVDTYPLTIYSAAAIQELNRKLAEELKSRDAENAALKRRLETLERLMNALSRRFDGGAR